MDTQALLEARLAFVVADAAACGPFAKGAGPDRLADVTALGRRVKVQVRTTDGHDIGRVGGVARLQVRAPIGAAVASRGQEGDSRESGGRDSASWLVSFVSPPSVPKLIDTTVAPPPPLGRQG